METTQDVHKPPTNPGEEATAKIRYKCHNLRKLEICDWLEANKITTEMHI